MKVAELTLEYFVKWTQYEEDGKTKYRKEALHVTIGLVTRENSPVEAFLFSTSTSLKPQTVNLTVDGESKGFQTVTDSRNSSDFVWFKDGNALLAFLSKGGSFKLSNATFENKEMFSNLKVSKLDLNKLYKTK